MVSSRRRWRYEGYRACKCWHHIYLASSTRCLSSRKFSQVCLATLQVLMRQLGTSNYPNLLGWYRLGLFRHQTFFAMEIHQKHASTSPSLDRCLLQIFLPYQPSKESYYLEWITCQNIVHQSSESHKSHPEVVHFVQLQMCMNINCFRTSRQPKPWTAAQMVCSGHLRWQQKCMKQKTLFSFQIYFFFF